MNKEGPTLRDLLGSDAILGEFKPHSFYDANLCTLTILLEDVSYVAQCCGMFEVLWHPVEDRIVGLRVLSPHVFVNGQEVIERLRKKQS